MENLTLTDRRRVERLTSLLAITWEGCMEKQDQPNCEMCKGTGKIEAWVRSDQGGMDWKVIRCVADVPDYQTAWNELKFLLVQFIRCKEDGPIDPANPHISQCDGCTIEREEVLNRVFHLAQNNAKA